jgi:hypothetical protein
MDFTHTMKFACIEKNSLRRCGFTSVDMSHNADVSNPGQGVLSVGQRFVLPFQGL